MNERLKEISSTIKLEINDLFNFINELLSKIPEMIKNDEEFKNKTSNYL
ncbi:hypothetical protein ACOSP6_11060 [Tenacibaculum sp. MEBiC06402]